MGYTAALLLCVLGAGSGDNGTVGMRTMCEESLTRTSVVQKTCVPGTRRAGSESGCPGGLRTPTPMVAREVVDLAGLPYNLKRVNDRGTAEL